MGGASLDRALRARVVPGRAEQEKRYLKSDREHLGVPVPAVREVAKAWVKAEKAGRPGGFGEAEALAVAGELWTTGIYEHASAGLEILRCVRLSPAALPFLEARLREAKTWALVDVIAPELVGPILRRHPAERGILDRWAGDPDPWVRRAALLADLLEIRKGEGDWDAWTRRADALLGDASFWIRKAIGWVLRERAKRRPDEVAAWIEPRAGRMAGLTFREATRSLPAETRAALEAARAAQEAQAGARRRNPTA